MLALDADLIRSFGDFGRKSGIAREVVGANAHIAGLLAAQAPHGCDMLSIDCAGLDHDLLAARTDINLIFTNLGAG